MKFSESWLREWVNPAIDTEQLVAQITMAGLEVDAVEPVAPVFSGVVVGEIVSAEQHPNADKLQVCQVKGNEGVVQVVCGAPNARAGIKVPFATVGAQLPEMKIKKAKLRDVESFGMLCGQDEVGLGEASDGLWELPQDAPVGEDLRVYLGLEDSIIEVDLTPNRGDCLSIRGLAREVGVLNGETVSTPLFEPVKASIDDVISIQSQAPQACPHYVGRIIRGVDISQPSPLWLQEKLRRSGIRSIDPVVDVTNYVLLELGQPMHAFDAAKVQDGIVVRMAEQGEKLALLDGSEATLNDDTLVIADHQHVLAMAGIMGGASSAVSKSTTDILLESAFFDPIAIAGKPRNYGLHTDSSHRFERGVDPQLQLDAIERATDLLLGIVGGQAGPVVEVSEPDYLPARSEIELDKQRLHSLLALQLDDQRVVDMLQRLGVATTTNSCGWRCVAPSWRFDITADVDLVEEIARIYGYNNLPTSTINADLPLLPDDESLLGLPLLRQQLTTKGYREAITYCFVDPQVQQHLTPEVEGVVLANPISADMSVMRTTLWSGLLTAVRHNLNRQQLRVRLFETGLRFLPQADGELLQQPMIAAAITGSRQPEGWQNVPDAVDFFDIKADVEALLALTDRSGNLYSFEPCSHPALHPGQAAQVLRDGDPVGVVGCIHPRVQKALNLSQAVYVFELQTDKITRNPLPQFVSLSRFPEVRRDIALIVDESLPASDLLKEVADAAGKSLIDVKIFDVYQGKGVENNRKSVAMGLTFRDSSRTLNEDEINVAIDAVVLATEKKFSASLRR